MSNLGDPRGRFMGAADMGKPGLLIASGIATLVSLGLFITLLVFMTRKNYKYNSVPLYVGAGLLGLLSVFTMVNLGMQIRMFILRRKAIKAME